MANQNIAALTGLRFIAATGVFLAHFAGFTFGSAGVSLFFVLSGFILTHAYEGRDWSLGRFYWSRFARIYPAYLFALLFSLELAWDFIPSPGFVLSVLTLTQGWSPDTSGIWNNVAWSLSVEAFFYLAFPFVLPLFRLRVLTLVVVIVSLWAVSLYIALTGDYSDHGKFVSQFPIFRLPEFLIGIAFGMIYRQIQVPGWMLPVSVVLLVPMIFGVPTGFAAPVFGLLILGLTRGNRFLSHPKMVRYGEASYSFYLLHVTMFYLIDKNVPQSLSGSIPVTVAAFGATLWLSLWAFKRIETPAREWLINARISNPAVTPVSP